ncbi:endo-1,3(4)-beta-glucanase-like protein [Westerdykella ornata]|uniref:Endo-1,3(4)-beta-glucanase-like protein n=1 Tax=Westerdykella ornata TaxID=318751 RepID=A0A6A6JHU8_WESOR|nr:endo-1,3(4)-beta-glucanase-like protein [Westerdykella ornata]KAF2275967.1 endo-1,3(4)-beta-glucanase-like protein [Westerdykella ornata]
MSPGSRLFVLLPLLWSGVSAKPAGPGYFPPGYHSPPVNGSDGEVSVKAYGLIEQYDSSNWLDKFDVQAMADPTHGFVNYVDAGRAQQLGLIRNQGSQVYMGVDSWVSSPFLRCPYYRILPTSILVLLRPRISRNPSNPSQTRLNPSGPGRDSVRIQSKRGYTRGLIIGDFAHIPGTACGSWPAFWMVGPNWPNQGELDIIEGVNLNQNNQVTLHTSPGCNVHVGDGGQTGRSVGNQDCGAGGGYTGCGVEAVGQPTSYGTPFNANGGGVYAALWTDAGIKVWYWAARDVPGNIRNGNPDPNSWGVPQANFAGCDFAAKFRDMHIVFDITFCGDWAGGVWGQSSCAQMNPSCNAYVAEQPQSFADTYWLINSIKVYGV